MPRPRLPHRPDESRRSLAARNALVDPNRGLVYDVARDLYRTSLLCRRLGEEDDLISVGHLALVRAAERWRDDGQAAFGTYAYRCIRLQILRSARDAGLIRVPDHISQAIQADRELPEQQRRDALAAWNCGRLPPCWDRTSQRERTSPAEELLPELLAELAPHERRLLAERFGLGGTPIRPHAAIAAEAGVVTTAIGHRVKAICKKLRTRLVEALDADYTARRAAA